MHHKLSCVLSGLMSCSIAFASPDSPPSVHPKPLPSAEPNVYELAETNQELASNMQLATVNAEIAKSDAMSATYQADLNNEMYDINTEIQHQRKMSAFSPFSNGWAVNVVMIVGGVVLVATGSGDEVGAALIVGGALSMIMMAPLGSQITSAVASKLIQAGVPPEDAQIVASVLLSVGMITLSMGAGAATGAAKDAVKDTTSQILYQNQMMLNAITEEEQAYAQAYSQEISATNQSMEQLYTISEQLRETSSSIANDMLSMVQSTRAQ